MKDSGVEWIGNIPNRWNVVKAKYIFENHKEIVGKDESKYERLSLTLNGVLKRPRDDAKGLQSESLETYQILRQGELVFKMIDLNNVSTSRVGYSPYEGLVSPVYIIFNNPLYSRFGYYYFFSMWQREIYNHLGNDGVRSSLNASDMLNLPFLLPPLSEQQKIVDFLDGKVKEIDNVIEKTKETIELYKKYKQAVITEAVTKGLDPNVEMRDTYSGICPIKWNLKKIKYSCEMQAGDNITSNEVDVIGSYPVYGGNGIRGFYNKSNCDGEHILIGRQGALAGNVHYVDEKIWATDHAVVVSNFRDDVKFMFYMFIAMNLNQYAYDTAAQPGISVAKIKNLEMAFPSVEEEKEIACFLDGRTRKIDDIIFNKIAFIKELDNYKKSLIYEYVTGKKEVK